MINFLNQLISRFVDFLVETPIIKNKIKSKESRKIIQLYAKTDYTKNFVKFRFWFGPLHEINKLTPKKGKILDIGSGEGILANFLAISGPNRKIIGIEINKDRVKEADKGIKNIKFINRSILDVKLPKTDTVIISHVLHHLGSKESQEKLLNILYKNLKKDSKIIIAEVDKNFSIRYLFGYIVDIFLVPVFFEKKFLDLKIYHRSRNEWENLFKGFGFKILETHLTKDRIYPEVIFVLTK